MSFTKEAQNLEIYPLPSVSISPGMSRKRGQCLASPSLNDPYLARLFLKSGLWAAFLHLRGHDTLWATGASKFKIGTAGLRLVGTAVDVRSSGRISFRFAPALLIRSWE